MLGVKYNIMQSKYRGANSILLQDHFLSFTEMCAQWVKPFLIVSA